MCVLIRLCAGTAEVLKIDGGKEQDRGTSNLA